MGFAQQHNVLDEITLVKMACVGERERDSLALLSSVCAVCVKCGEVWWGTQQKGQFEHNPSRLTYLLLLLLYCLLPDKERKGMCLLVS